MIKDLVIIGAGGFGREVAWLVEDINKKEVTWNLLGFIDGDKSKKGEILNGYPVLGDCNDLSYINDFYAVCAIGDPKVKKKLVDEAFQRGYKFANLIHPSIVKSKNVDFGVGNIICAHTILTVNIRIGNHVILNLDCTVGHDVVINDFCTCAPSVNISGNTILEEGCDIGTNASIVQNRRVGPWCIIGAGAVVATDMPPKCTAVGVPAKPIKFHG